MPINDQIFARMDELSPAEKKVARKLLADYPGAGLASAAALARSAGTSPPTVLRLLSRLGIGSYPQFQRRLRDEVNDQLNGSRRQPESETTLAADGDQFRRAVAERAALVNELACSVPPSEFDRTVQLLADRPRQVLITGGYFSRYLAMTLATELDEVIPGVEFVSDPSGRQFGKFLNLTRGSVVLILDFRRYEAAAVHIAQSANSRGAAVVVVTDQELSPAAEYATAVLPAPVGGAPFDSMVGVLALLEALVNSVLAAVGKRGMERMRAWYHGAGIVRTRGD